MHRHLHAVPRPTPLRPAKVVQLEVRRQARLDAVAPAAVPPKRPAA